MPEPEEGGLEKTVKSGNIFDQIGGSIGSLVAGVKEIPKIAKKVAHYTYYTAKAALGCAVGVVIAGASALVGAPLTVATAINILHAGYKTLILPVGIATGAWLGNLKNKTKTTYKQIANNLCIGGILGGYLHHIFAGATHAGNLVKGAYGAIAGAATKAGIGIANIPVFMTIHEYLNRGLIKDYEPIPFKENMGQLKGPMAALIPLIGLNYLSPAAYQMPVAAGVSTAYGLLKGDKKKEEKEPARENIPFPQKKQYQVPDKMAA